VRRRYKLALGAGVILVAAAGASAAWYVNEQTRTKNVRGSETEEFVASAEPAGVSTVAPPTPTAAVTATSQPERSALRAWPMYGFEPGRTRVAEMPGIRPPFRLLWQRDTRLIEFPPVAANGNLFVAESRGALYAVVGRSGRQIWRREFKRCSAGSPAYAGGVIYHAFMHGRCKRVPGARGLVVALDAETGKLRWKAETQVVESSILHVSGRLYFGGWDGQIVSLDAATGRQIWSFRADSGITSSVAYHDGIVFVGSDRGQFYALNAATGKLVWQNASYATFGQREYFYATPAIAYGRVFAPNTDGYVYSFGEKSGKLRWARRAGTYVYSAPAILRRTVYVGTYDGYLVALDAATGEIKWRRQAPAAIHGAVTIIDDVAYYSTIKGSGDKGSARFVKGGPGRSFGLDLRTGRINWRRDEGRYTPVIADGERLYFVGYGWLYGLGPK
jgi:outer membrane protein assembly factor BamB